ncbi:hypothetical protein PybrP1_001330, partial [[Pythium] brassicae (nom. inval.)]
AKVAQDLLATKLADQDALIALDRPAALHPIEQHEVQQQLVVSPPDETIHSVPADADPHWRARRGRRVHTSHARAVWYRGYQQHLQTVTAIGISYLRSNGINALNVQVVPGDFKLRIEEMDPDVEIVGNDQPMLANRSLSTSWQRAYLENADNNPVLNTILRSKLAPLTHVVRVQQDGLREYLIDDAQAEQDAQDSYECKEREQAATRQRSLVGDQRHREFHAHQAEVKALADVGVMNVSYPDNSRRLHIQHLRERIAHCAATLEFPVAKSQRGKYGNEKSNVDGNNVIRTDDFCSHAGCLIPASSRGSVRYEHDDLATAFGDDRAAKGDDKCDDLIAKKRPDTSDSDYNTCWWASQAPNE